MSLHKAKIVNKGIITHVFVDDEEVICRSYELTQNAGECPVLRVEYPLSEIDVDLEQAGCEEKLDCIVCGGEGTMVGTRAPNGHFHGVCKKCGARLHA